jgi:two-component system copper resistance phosphate regulon response regulator CusR
MRILLIEDDTGIARVIKRGLEQAQYDVDVAHDGAQGLEMALEGSYALLILDLMLPGMDGRQVCEELRNRRSKIPMLMLTALGTLEDRVHGLELGADDYLVKPFEFPELIARVRALVRRDRLHRTRVIHVGDLEIDTALHRVTRAGMEIGLSHREYELLEGLAAREGQVLSREAIHERIWMDEDTYSNTVDVYIGLLRKKIDAGHDIKLIQTIRGVGYAVRRPADEIGPS